jgi:sulfite dehydrogenase (quinone) subunit SoeC
MNPAFSIIFFTTLAGTGQGLVVSLAVASLLAVPMSPAFVTGSLATAAGLLCIALAASFFHLGHPLRAWRAALMWRTSWMSREVIVLPAYMGLIVLWTIHVATRQDSRMASDAWAIAAIIGAFGLWYCTAMIYACIRFIQEWAHPLTVINYTLIGLSSGLVLAGALAMAAGEREFVTALGPWAVGTTLLAWLVRSVSVWRNARLKPKSSLHSATGIPGSKLVQKSMGLTGGSFNTREFFHHSTDWMIQRVRLTFHALGFALPLVLVGWGLYSGSPAAWLLAVPIQFLGLVAERWFFFAQARHPQNLYYQAVS